MQACSVRIVCSLHSALCSLRYAVCRWPAADAAFPELPPPPSPPPPLDLALPCLLALPGPSSLLSSLIQSQHIRCQHAPQTLPRSSDWPSMPSQDHSSSMRLLVRRSANNQRGERGGPRNPQALGVQAASSLSCFTAAVDPAAHQTTQLQSSSRPSPSLMGFPNAANHAGSGQHRGLCLESWASGDEGKGLFLFYCVPWAVLSSA